MRKAEIFFLLVCCLLYGTGNGIVLKCEKAVGSQQPDYTFFLISDVTADEEGNLYVLDYKGCSLKKFSEEGRFLKSFGRRGEGPGEFLRPSTLYYFHKKLYIYDRGKHKIIVLDKDLNFLKELKISAHIMDFFIANGKFYVSLMPVKNYYHFAIFKPADHLLELERYFFNRKVDYIEDNFRLKNSKFYLPLRLGYGFMRSDYSPALSRIAATYSICTKQYRLFLFDLNGKLVSEKRINLDARCRRPTFSYFLNGGKKKEEMIEIHDIAFFNERKLLIKYRYTAEGIEIGEDYLAVVDLDSGRVEGTVKLDKPSKLLGAKNGVLYLTKGEDVAKVYICRLSFSGKGR